MLRVDRVCKIERKGREVRPQRQRAIHCITLRGQEADKPGVLDILIDKDIHAK